MWNCVCDCGKQTVVLGYNLKKGITKSCGCLQKETTSNKHYLHGDSHRRLHGIWTNMKSRCYNTKVCSYINYGARGIKVCDEWRNSYMAFKMWALTHGYKDNLTIERMDYNGNYEPDNCCWIPINEQAANKRGLRYLTYNGETHFLAEWARITGISDGTIRKRIDRLGWTICEALSTPKEIRHGR